jgi:hypothetical protein
MNDLLYIKEGLKTILTIDTNPANYSSEEVYLFFRTIGGNYLESNNFTISVLTPELTSSMTFTYYIRLPLDDDTTTLSFDFFSCNNGCDIDYSLSSSN